MVWNYSLEGVAEGEEAVLRLQNCGMVKLIVILGLFLIVKKFHVHKFGYKQAS